MKSNKRSEFFGILLGFLSYISFGQEIPEGYYQFPIRPGEQNFLAGTVGEIRASHFHTGIDIKTYGRIGIPVYAVADGYISRIKVAPGGYGKVLYMRHTNGTFSVYAHLNDFVESIHDFVLYLQYQNEDYSVDSLPKKYQFAFEKGDLIAYSGNTGFSDGPHLHFEIRNSDNQPIDVLSMGFNEIKDTKAPVVAKIAFVTLDENARVNGYFRRKEVSITNRKLAEPISLKGKIGVEIYSYDPMNDVPNKNGIMETSLTIKGEKVFKEKKKTFSFGKQRNALVHYNYQAKVYGSRRFNRLYLSDGNEHDIYEQVNRGIDFEGGEELTIELLDSYANRSKYTLQLSKEDIHSPAKIRSSFEILENYLHFTSAQQAGIALDEWKSIEPYNRSKSTSYYLWDLRKGLPTQLLINSKTIRTDFVSTIPPNHEITHVQEEFEIMFYRRTLFDTLYLRFEKSYDPDLKREYFTFKNTIDPLRNNATIILKPQRRYDEKARIYSVYGRRTHFIGGEWKEGNITFNTRNLTKYTILTDSVPPTVIPQFLSQKEIKIKINDLLSGIREYRAELNGRYLLLKYEPKKRLLFSDKNDPNIPFKGAFKLTVIDNSDNITTYKNNL